MKKYKIKKVEIEDFEKFICDRCKREFLHTDEMELQETYTISFTAGYGSVFGDMTHVNADLCQYCLIDLIGSFATYNWKGE